MATDERVDVGAVLEAAQVVALTHAPLAVAEIKRARAAVAELIATSRYLQAVRQEFREWSSLHPDEPAPRQFLQRMQVANERHVAALSHFGTPE